MQKTSKRIGIIILTLATLIVGSGSALADFSLGSTSFIDVGTPNLFNQAEGSPITFSSSASGQADTLRSANRIMGAFSVAVRFSDFTSNNMMQPGSGNGSGVSLFLSPGALTSTSPRVEYGMERTNYLEAVTPAQTTVIAPVPNMGSGWLQITYTSKELTFWYGSPGEWSQIGGAYKPEWSQAPFIFLRGSNDRLNEGGTQAMNLSFQLTDLQVNAAPVPVPPSILLLAPGLAGLAAIRRRFRK